MTNHTFPMKKLTPFLLVLPIVVLLLIFKLYPILIGLWESMHGPAFYAAPAPFVGLDNFARLFTDPVFWDSVRVTLMFNLLVNPIQVALALGLAVLLNIPARGLNVFRSIQFIPVAVSLPIAAVLWSIMLHPEQGVVNSILVGVGLPPQPFLNSSDQALWVIVLIATWKGVGYWSIFLLAGLQEIPSSIYEAAALDGSSGWRTFTSITLPLMKRPLTFVLVADTVTNFLLFAPMYMLTGGGPARSTNVLMLESFRSAFLFSDPGRASAIVVVLLVITLAIVVAQFRLLRSRH